MYAIKWKTWKKSPDMVKYNVFLYSYIIHIQNKHMWDIVCVNIFSLLLLVYCFFGVWDDLLSENLPVLCENFVLHRNKASSPKTFPLFLLFRIWVPLIIMLLDMFFSYINFFKALKGRRFFFLRLLFISISQSSKNVTHCIRSFKDIYLRIKSSHLPLIILC